MNSTANETSRSSKPLIVGLDLSSSSFFGRIIGELLYSGSSFGEMVSDLAAGLTRESGVVPSERAWPASP